VGSGVRAGLAVLSWLLAVRPLLRASGKLAELALLSIFSRRNSSKLSSSSNMMQAGASAERCVGKVLASKAVVPSHKLRVWSTTINEQLGP
jgi:hypothetical protein